MERLSSVLVVRLSSLGDVLFAVPAVQALLDSGLAGRVSWLVEDRAAPLLAAVPGLHEIVVVPRTRPARWLPHALALRRRRDDLVLDLQGTLKSRIQLALLRSPRKVGFDSTLAREGADRALDEALAPPPWAVHRVTQGLALVAALGVPVRRPPPRPVLRVDAAARERARRFLSGLSGDGPAVVLHPGTSAFGELKRWPADRFAALGMLLAVRAGARLVVTGSPAEAPLVAAVRAGLPPAATAAPPAGTLQDLAALLAEADLVVAADSLPLHLANALGTPVVGLYGPKDPAVTGPFFDGASVVRAGVACSPCTLRRCGDRICMERLAIEAVAEAARDRLEQGREDHGRGTRAGVRSTGLRG